MQDDHQAWILLGLGFSGWTLGRCFMIVNTVYD